MNWYAYVGNDPVNFSDPTGMIGAGLTTNWGIILTGLSSGDSLEDINRRVQQSQRVNMFILDKSISITPAGTIKDAIEISYIFYNGDFPYSELIGLGAGEAAAFVLEAKLKTKISKDALDTLKGVVSSVVGDLAKNAAEKSFELLEDISKASKEVLDEDERKRMAIPYYLDRCVSGVGCLR